MTKNPATKFVRNDRIECQLIKAGLTEQPNLYLALAMNAFKTTGEYDTQIREFEAKPAVDDTFQNFQTFNINEYAKCTKHNKSIAKALGFSITNAAISAV